MNNELMFSSATDDWGTPKDFFEKVNDQFSFDLDVCASDSNAKCERYYTKEQDGLSKAWHTEGSKVWMNPPYGRQIKAWVKKAYEESEQGATVVCLLPARTDTAWWHDYCMRGEIRFIRGRLKFGNSKTNAPFPSALVIFRGKDND